MITHAVKEQGILYRLGIASWSGCMIGFLPEHGKKQEHGQDQDESDEMKTFHSDSLLWFMVESFQFFKNNRFNPRNQSLKN